MKKLILLLFLLLTSIFGAEPATKEDIDMLVKMIEANQKSAKDDIAMLIKIMEANQEATNKRIDLMQNQMDKRFDDMKEYVDKRFDASDKRFEMIQHQINTTNSYILGLLVGIFGLIGVIFWDRRTMIHRTKTEMRDELEKVIEERIAKRDRVLLDKILDIIEKVAKDDKETQELLKKHRMNFA